MRHGLPAAISGLLLFAAFPPLEWSPAAWVALVPLLAGLARCSQPKAFRAGFIAGVLFWWGSIAWLTRVTFPGCLLLGAYCALFIGLFAKLASGILRFGMARGSLARLGTLFAIPALWVGLEYLRSTFLTGFAWNPLGLTQAGLRPLIQCAEWGGVYVVSFLVVMVNTALVLLLARLGPAGNADQALPPAAPAVAAGGPSGAAWWQAILPLLAGGAILAGAWLHGLQTLRRLDAQPGLPLRLALIQLNVPQFEKMIQTCASGIEERLRQGTLAAVKRHKPELVIWPETAVPTFTRGVPSTEKLIAELLELGVPILVGTMDYGLINTRTVYFNSSFLFDPERGLTQTYAKQHLVIFGEYIPLDDVYPWLRRLAPIEESFTAGSVQTVFRLDTSPRAFAVLICFEDTVAALARRAVRAGARLLVNQTNDAWFDPSWASRQHMLQCVFRCVENRVPAVRSTNTGITCYIDRTGRVIASLPPTRGQNQPPECLAQTVLLPGPEMPLTFYTRHGDWFAWVCLGLAALALLAAWKMGPDQKISA